MVRQLTITAELKRWSLNDEANSVSGVIHNSVDLKYYPDGEEWVLCNITLVHFPTSARADEYWLARNQTGLYFKLIKSEMM